MPPESLNISFPAAPGNNATAVIFNSATQLGSGKNLRSLQVVMVELTWFLLDQASAANGLKFYASIDAGTNWRQCSLPDDTGTATMPVSVAALAASTNHTFRFVTTQFNDVKIEWTAGATGPTATTGWEGCVAVHRGGIAVVR